MVNNDSAAWKVSEIPTQEQTLGHIIFQNIMCICVHVCLNTANCDSKSFFKCSKKIMVIFFVPTGCQNAL